MAALQDARSPAPIVVLFEPNRYDAEMFFTNIFSYSSRRRLAEHAYQKTREELLRAATSSRRCSRATASDCSLDALRDPDRHLVRAMRRAARLLRAGTAAPHA